MAKALNSSGLFALGYKYMALDDGWQARPARVNGTLSAHPTRFSDGMAALKEALGKIPQGLHHVLQAGHLQ